ncbi:ABC transporter substrate-binding protein [Shouchella clausii]
MNKKACAFAVFLLLAGCQGASSETENKEPSKEGAYSVTDFAERTVSFEHPPERVAVLGNGELDIVYALGKEVVGRPTSAEPAVVAEAEEAAQVGSSHEIDMERLTFANPDLVLGSFPMNEKDVPAIEGMGANVLLTSANSVSEIEQQIELIGQALQEQEEAEKWIATIKEKKQELSANPLHKKEKVLLVYGAPGSNLAALPNSLAGDILDIAGGENVASSFEQLDDFPQYAALSPERIMEANPHRILFMAHGDPTNVQDGFIKEMEQHAGWSQLPAVKEGKIEILPADLFGTNPGTNITEALDYMRALLEEDGAEQ